MKISTQKPLTLQELTEKIVQQENNLRQGGGEKGIQRQKRLGRLPVRERLELLLDDLNSFFELELWAGYEMYPASGEIPAAGVVTGIGKVQNRDCMIIANDATVKAGAMFPISIKKVLRAQRIAYKCRLPIIYLVDSSGVFLPLQDEIFPDEDDFGRIFRNNAVLSAMGVPQFAAIMGNCIAGGGYLPVLCDKLLMTEGSGLYLAGPALVKAAIGQEVDTEELGGAHMHAEVSGTVDFLEPNDQSCLVKLRSLIAFLPKDSYQEESGKPPKRDPHDLYSLVGADGKKSYDLRDVLNCIVDSGSFQEYKADYGKNLVVGYARLDGMPVGIVGNQRIQTQTGEGEVEIGGVIYADGADKAARFIMDCNQMKIPLIFLQDAMGFMVGSKAEQSGIIRAGAKMVNTVSNSIVPKITVILGNAFGAGHYALCGKAYDPNFILSWPNAKYAVMGPTQVAETLFTIQKRGAERDGHELDDAEMERLHAEVAKRYEEQMDIRYGAARGWIDAIIEPHKTRDHLIQLLRYVSRMPMDKLHFHTGVLQV